MREKGQTWLGHSQGKLLVVKDLGIKNSIHYWLCACDCGGSKVYNSGELGSGRISCGCAYKDAGKRIRKYDGGARNHEAYGVYRGMKERCSNPSYKKYSDYGGRGIKVCQEWLDDVGLFLRWAEENGYEKGLEIDRIDNNNGYSPDNCRFVTRHKNVCNQRLLRKDNKSGYRGVTVREFKRSDGSCRVEISAAVRFKTGIKTKKVRIGVFNSTVEAAIERDIYTIKNKFDLPLNFPELANGYDEVTVESILKNNGVVKNQRAPKHNRFSKFPIEKGFSTPTQEEDKNVSR